MREARTKNTSTRIMNVPGPVGSCTFLLAMTNSRDGAVDVIGPPLSVGDQIHCNGRHLVVNGCGRTRPAGCLTFRGRAGRSGFDTWFGRTEVLTRPAWIVMTHGRNERCDRPRPPDATAGPPPLKNDTF